MVAGRTSLIAGAGSVCQRPMVTTFHPSAVKHKSLT